MVANKQPKLTTTAVLTVFSERFLTNFVDVFKNCYCVYFSQKQKQEWEKKNPIFI